MTQTPAPRIDVVIPVHNRPTMVREAAASALDQVDGDIRVVVVDDGSTDDTPEVIDEIAAHEPRITAIHQSRAGPSTARNVGVRACDAELIVFLDSDDLLAPRGLATLRRVLVDERADGVLPRGLNVFAPGVEVPTLFKGLPEVDARTPWMFTTMLIRREVFEQVGGFDESLQLGEDTDLYARLTRGGYRIIRHDEVLVDRRISGDNLVFGIDPRRTVLDLVRRFRQPPTT